MKERTRAVIGVGLAFSVVFALFVPGAPAVLKILHDLNPASPTPDYETVVIFRNDDIEPGHRDDLRRTVDRIFVEEGVPLTNAVIPTMDGESIANNETFCEELREHRRDHPNLVEYSLHGYLHEPTTHTFADGKDDFEEGVTTEFGGLPFAKQVERISNGSHAMSECLGTRPRSFVPPYGTYDDTTLRALSTENLGIVSGSGWFVDAYYDETGPFETDGMLHVPADQGFVQDWDTLEFHDQHYLREQFDAAYEDGSLYVQILHYWTFDSEERRETLRSFIGYVKGHEGVLFMTVEQFAEAYRDGRLRKVDGGWSYSPPDDGSEGVSTAELDDWTAREADFLG